MLMSRAARAGGEQSYIAPGSELAYVVARAPLPARQLGVIALTAAAALGEPSLPIPAILGLPLPGAIPPPGWPGEPVSGTVGRAPFAAVSGSGKDARCRCETVLGDTRTERVAVLYASTRFTVGDELGSLRMLHLRVRYRDGLVAYINGREVARRNLGAAAGPMDLAERPHGPEWESFYIPLVPGLLRPGDNLLAVEVHPSGNNLAPMLDLALGSSTVGRIVRGPMVQRVSATEATVVFETDLPVTGLVEYGPTAARGLAASSAGGGLAVRHLVRLRDLPPGEAVHYRVVAGADASGELVLHTAPAAGEVIRFVVYGDVRGGHDTHETIVRAVMEEAPDFVVATGDLVMRGSDEADWQRFFAVSGQLMARAPYYPVAGNHDTGRSGDEGRRLNEIFALWPGPPERPEWGHWYSFDVADVHMVMLDSNAFEHHEQLRWLEADLAAAQRRGVRAIFAVMHDGPYSRGIHRGSRYAAKHYAPLLARYGVSLTFSGHDHLYQRGEIDGFAYMVSGGGGAPLYSVRCGVPGKSRCAVEDGMKHIASEHHYIVITVYGDHLTACPLRIDRTPLEACVSYPLRSR